MQSNPNISFTFLEFCYCLQSLNPANISLKMQGYRLDWSSDNIDCY